MPDEKEGQPEVQQPVVEQILPETNEPPKEDKSEVLSKELEQVKQEWEKSKQEKADLEKRLKDNQEYISRTRNVDKPTTEIKPQKSFDEYLEDVVKKFEDDPKEGFKKVVRDMVYDRDLERQANEKRVKEAEENAFRRVLTLDPEKGRVMREVENLDKNRPDLSNLTFEQKIEFLNMSQTKTQQSETRQKVERDRELSSDVGGGGSARGERLPGWVNDPQIIKDAAEAGFTSKQDLLEWSDPMKARLKAEKMRPKLVLG